MAAYISFEPKDFFNILTYTGDGTAARSLTGLGFLPAMSWIKCATEGYNHTLYDAVRGAGSGKALEPSTTQDEGGVGDATYGYISSFDADGISVAEGSGGSEIFNNADAETYLNWNWKAGTTSGIAAGSQTITPSSYSIDTTRKFGIYAYTGNGTGGATISHGLGSAPNAIIIKRLDTDYEWQVGQSYTTEGDGNDWGSAFVLNTNAVSSNNVAYWNDTDPTSTLITLGDHNSCNGSTYTYIMYAWCDVPGMQKFGMYMGNGNANGAQVNLGFRPALLITKRLSTSQWNMFSDTIPGYNLTPNRVFADSDAAQSTSTTNSVDFLSNGFKLRGSGDETNGNQNNYIYFAWSKFPTVSSNDIPGVAR
mgnify:CR=1 FL=1|tara:strand:+ start:137 stop:1231 length:1095 start_codon:yes stop_codon:yes gene_type:complete